MNFGWLWARFLARWILGLMFFMAGWMKVFQVGPTEFAKTYFVEPYADTWLPETLLWVTGASVPWIELIGGALLCLGLFTTITSVTLGGLLIMVTYGHLLKDPLFSISDQVLPRLILLFFVFGCPKEMDRLSLDYWWMIRRTKPE